MKICQRCNQPVDDNMTFCPNCGSSELRASNPDMYPMKWFKFLIYFLLFLGAISNLVSGINYITGNIYYVQTIGLATADMVYEVFGGLKMIDIIYGAAMIVMAGFGIYTRFALAKYKSYGPTCLYILYGGAIAVSLLYNIAVMAVTGINAFDTASVTSIAVSAGVIALNYTYFNKRKELFVN